MKLVSRFFRLAQINYILARYNIDSVLLGKQPYSPLHLLAYANPFYWTVGRKLSRGERIRRALEELGPIFVKAGQVLSTRRDLIPEDISAELSKLQDNVPPFPGRLAQSIVEKALGQPIDDIFSYFCLDPLASASIAQVHEATLPNGEEVVVKVLRPDIQTLIKRDTDLLLSIAKTTERYFKPARRFKPVEMAKEITYALYSELDLVREGANATQIKRNFKSTAGLYIPKITWEFSRPNILVMEKINGIPAHDIQGLKNAGIQLDILARNMIELFFTQVFRDSFFHADLHPGNIFVSTDKPLNPTIILVDFGIVGSLSREDQRYLAENIMAFFKRDYQRVAELHVACGWVPPNTRIDLFEGAIRAVSEPIFEQPLKDVSFGQLLMKLFQVAREFHINIQPQLILLQKTLVNIEGLSRQLAPNLDLWATAAPEIEKWLKKQVGVRAFLKRVRENLPLWSEQLPEMPSLIYEVLRETKQHQEKKRFLEASSTQPAKPAKWRYFIAGIIISLTAVSLYTLCT